MRRRLLLWWLLLLLEAQRGARAPLIPRHALSGSTAHNNNNWTACATGFFRTTPSTPLGTPTCRVCDRAVCALGEGPVACAPTRNAHCAPCPDLPLGRAFVQPGDCARTRCLDGWRLLADACAPCDAGWVCRDDARTPCPGNCTDAIGVAQTLQCTGGPIEDVQLQYSLAASDGPLPAFDASAALDALMHRWLLYGVYQGCVRASLGVVGTLTCVLSVPQCVRAPFREWLLKELPAQQAAIASTQGAAVRMSPPSIRILPSTLRRHANATARPTHAPALVIRPRAWGQSHLEPLLTLGACAAVLGGLTAGVAAACALAYVHWRRRAEQTARAHVEARRLRA